MAFTIFQNFPIEIRLLIWERVPQPKRLVGQVPCSTCSATFRSTEDRNAKREHCIRATHPDWRLRFISQPVGHSVFPPLHACRESRRVWLPQYCRLPRYVNLSNGDESHSRAENGDRTQPSYHLRFDIPFISYETDIFTIFDVWTRGQVDIAPNEPLNPDPLEHIAFDPFIGLDRKRIQHVALGESAEHLARTIISLDFHSLPLLRGISVLSYGPAPQLSLAHLNVEMRPSDVQNHRCKIIDVPQELVQSHKMFREGRLRHPQFEPRPHMRHLSNHVAVLKALMWHAAHTEIIGLRQESFSSIIAFEDFVLGALGQTNHDQTRCPLEHVPGCGLQGHECQEMVLWTMSFEIDFLMICEESLADGFTQSLTSSLQKK
ncbi:hypothetical protein CcaCcLH18_06390 [Colletotrichum camelliae]|nr:hypothetical protein CcaCcLH18_06390 [Colletotrichum camelliae]